MEIKKDLKHYKKLFLSTFLLSMFTFGGGYVIITLMKKKFVDEFGWIEEKEMLDIVAISQSSPGIIAVNASILIGYRIAGFVGALITILGTVLPPLIVITIVSFFYTSFKSNVIVNNILFGMRAGVGAVIVDVVIKMFKNVLDEKSKYAFFVMGLAFVLSFFLNINVILIIFLGGISGLLSLYISSKRKPLKPKEEAIPPQDATGGES